MRILEFTGTAPPEPSRSWTIPIQKKFLDTIFGFKGTQPIQMASQTTASTDSQIDTMYTINISDAWRIVYDRKNLCRDIDNMDRQDEIISKALDIIATYATAFDDSVNYRKGEKPGKTAPVNKGYETGFRVTTDNPEVKRVLDALITRLSLDTEIWQITRRFVKYGVYLPEVRLSLDKKMIVALDETSPYEIWPKTDGKNHKVPGWEYRKDQDVSSGQQWESMQEWQICPFSYGPRQGYFTMPMLGTARYNWKRLMRIEDNMAVQRLKSADRYVHKVPVSPTATVDEVTQAVNAYRLSLTKRKSLGVNNSIGMTDNPLDANVDFYIPTNKEVEGGVEILNPSNAHLSNLTDIYYYRERILARMGVPITLLQITSAQKTHLTAASSSLNGVDKQFSMMLRDIQEVLRKGLYRLMDMELILSECGVIPEPGLYRIELPIISTRDRLAEAKINLANAQAAIYMIEAFGALPLEILEELFMDLTTEQQEIMAGFISTWGNKVITARIQAIQNAAIAPPKPAAGLVPGKGSGNSNKPKAKRSTEQKPSKQSVPLLDVANMLTDMRQNLENKLREHGLPEDVIMQAKDAWDIAEDLLEFADYESEDN